MIVSVAEAGAPWLLPAAYRRDLAAAPVTEEVAVVAGHIGAAAFEPLLTGGYRFRCPACGGWDFGPTATLQEAVSVWLRGGRLPGGQLLGGACLECGHIISPEGRDVPVED